MVLETHMKLCVTEPVFLENVFFLPPKLGKWTKNGTNPPFGKDLVPEMQALSHSGCRSFKSTISPEQIDETASFLHFDTSYYKLKVNQKIFVWAWSKMVVTNLHSGL